MEPIYEKLTGIFREVFDDQEINIEPKTTADDIDEWDSLTHINLILMIELKFGIEFKPNEIRKFKNVGDMAAAIERYISK